ncbi:cobyrinate a,c-diamide synthase [Cupriavidus agavae]|uniref:Hydrogenobyrinic acid a,c-diamide synthase (Glutamine-hydrolysing) /cobyrinate a,c-diamide synthase n=1 Tax=Cupriavidus agavae TaxID=1001822 RepID=A0A4Q7RRK8_9BURK|nr:cobyrinate a,c-diamide synthase [Cupriavidus agavae]RZT36264.1 hydrogenobyrinic acid a,c-diamide synthase (glutamine-hydrolysing) /cobyrinate a,c-diamide synthase [Cupriavidus agavae]
MPPSPPVHTLVGDVPRVPALFVAAPASGQGKTTVTAALARLHARQGRRVRVFKTGPDFLDPTLLAAASGAPVHNIDLWMTGEADARVRLAAAARDADLILVEGVMGLHDGTPSGADVARLFDLPVLAVIQAGAMAQTFGAIAHGLASYGAPFRAMHVLANGVGTERHATMLRESLRGGIEWAGALARDAAASLPERHLGLFSADELPDLLTRLDRLADALAPLPVGRLPDPVPICAAAAPSLPPLLAGRRIAIARDDAFRFIYPANVDTLAALGADIAWFSPLRDTALPACDALWLPGGYPELHAATLAANQPMLQSLRDAHAAGVPMLAECGGMMALFDTLVDREGKAHPMAGLLPGTVTMQARLAAIGHQAVVLPWTGLPVEDNEIRGHTFHYSTTASELAPAATATSPRPGGKGEAVYRRGSLTASYVHGYFPSNPAAIAALFGG